MDKIDSEHEDGLRRMADAKSSLLKDPDALNQAIIHSESWQQMAFFRFIGKLVEYGFEYGEKDYDVRIKEETADELSVFSALVEGIIEDYLESEE